LVYQKKMKQRGAFIVLEGVDRSGKTTQAGMLVAALRAAGYPVEGRQFPNRSTHTGQLIDKYLKGSVECDDRTIHLLFSANRWEARDSIIRALNNGITLIVDRYTYSGVAFSIAKGLDGEWCRDPDRGLPRPDCVLFLDVDNTQDRGEFGLERYERKEFQHAVYQAYLTLYDSTIWHLIDASERSINCIHADLLRVALDTISVSQFEKINTL
jgi:dTMP kinase